MHHQLQLTINQLKMILLKRKTIIMLTFIYCSWTTIFTFSTCWIRTEMAFSVWPVWVSPTTDNATAAAISDDLNSRKSIPALDSHTPNYHLLFLTIIIKHCCRELDKKTNKKLPLAALRISWTDFKIEAPIVVSSSLILERK